jgi:hypothetical protein
VKIYDKKFKNLVWRGMEGKIDREREREREREKEETARTQRPVMIYCAAPSRGYVAGDCYSNGLKPISEINAVYSKRSRCSSGGIVTRLEAGWTKTHGFISNRFIERKIYS